MKSYQYQSYAAMGEEVQEEEPHFYSELEDQYYNNYDDDHAPFQYYMDDQPEQQSFQEEEIDLNSLQGILNAVTSAGDQQRSPEQEAREVVEGSGKPDIRQFTLMISKLLFRLAQVWDIRSNIQQIGWCGDDS